MIEVVVRKDELPYSQDYDAWLVGWVVLDGEVKGLVVEDHLDSPWLVVCNRIEVKVPKV